MSDYSLSIAKDLGRLEGAGISALRDMESVRDTLSHAPQDDAMVKLALTWLESCMKALASSLKTVEENDVERYGEALTMHSDIVAKYATKDQ